MLNAVKGALCMKSLEFKKISRHMHIIHPGRSQAVMSKRAYFILSLLVVAICFANSLPDGFILDDYHIVATNPVVRTLAPVHFFMTPYWGKKGQVPEYRPVTMLSFALEYPLWHRWAGGYRLGNLLLHSIN